MTEQLNPEFWDTWKMRCHALGKIMAPPKLKADKEAGNLSATAKSYLLQVWIKERKGRKKDIISKYIKKGLAVEEDSITLYSRVKKHFFKKNTERLHNKWIQGEPDLFEGENILNALCITDCKSSWDIYTFYNSVMDMITDGINMDYYWQLMGYMDLSGAKYAKLSYELINTPAPLVDAEKSKLLWSLGGHLALTGNESLATVYDEGCKLIDLSMNYDDIPIEERAIEFHIDRNDEEIELIHKKVEKCREYLKYLDDTLPKSIRLSYSKIKVAS